MKSEDVYWAARRFNGNHNHRFENVFVYKWESDLFSVTSTDYAIEIEVKVSRSDFFADFKKDKHFLLSKHNHTLLTMRGSCYSDNFSSINVVEVHKLIPNRFYFCCPKGMLLASEIPKYAGLIHVKDGGEYSIIKNAPLLHKDKFDYKKMLFNKYMYGYINGQSELNQLKRSLDFMHQTYNDTITLKPTFISPL